MLEVEQDFQALSYQFYLCRAKLNISITLFESNKKAKFLMELTKKLELNTKVYASRVESINKNMTLFVAELCQV